LAAGAMALEIAALRLKASGIQNIGIKALEESIATQHSKLKTIEGTLKPETYKAMQKEVSRLINKMNVAENNATYRYQIQMERGMDAMDDRNQQQENSADPYGVLQ
jgi:arginine repressor